MSQPCVAALDVQPAPLILLVDDDPLIRGGTAEMLRGAGYAALEVGSGREALRIFAIEPAIAMLITDNRMPEMTGAELISLIRAQAPDLPILLVTGYSSRGEDIGLDIALLAKPFREARLLAAVRELLEGSPVLNEVRNALERVKGIEPSS